MSNEQIPIEAVRVVAERMLQRYASEYQADHLRWSDFADDACGDLAAALPHLVPVEKEGVGEAAVIVMKAISLTNGRDTYPGFSARGATRKNGSAQILKKHNWYWLSPIRAYATKDGPDAVAKTVQALRDAGLAVEHPKGDDQ